jgi:hypothetical protein
MISKNTLSMDEDFQYNDKLNNKKIKVSENKSKSNKKKSMSSKTLELKECSIKNNNKKIEIKDHLQSPVAKDNRPDSQITNTSTTVKSQDKFKNQHSFSECSSCTSTNLRCKYDKLKIVFEVEKDVIKIQSKVREFLTKLKLKKMRKKQLKIYAVKIKNPEENMEKLKKKNKLPGKTSLSFILEEKLTLDSPRSNIDKLNFTKSIPSDMESDISESNLSGVTYNSLHTISISDDSNCSLNIVY